MDYFKAFETLKKALEKAEISVPEGHFAIQVRMNDDDCAGIFYIEAKDKQLNIEPYDYYDHDVDILTSRKDFKSIIEGKLDPLQAIESGKIVVSGYTEGLLAFLGTIPKKSPAKKATVKKTTTKPAKDPAEKKAPTKKTAAKATKKKTEAVKVKEDAKKPETTETIADVVKKEVKPEKKTKK